MDIRKVKKLIEMMEESDISEIEIKEGEDSVRISRGGVVVPLSDLKVPERVLHWRRTLRPSQAVSLLLRRWLEPFTVHLRQDHLFSLMWVLASLKAIRCVSLSR